MSARQLLEHAAEVLDERAGAYGPAAASMKCIAMRWSVTLGRPVTPAEVVLCMIDLKLARLQYDPAHRDSITDIIGYAALLPEVWDDRNPVQTDPLRASSSQRKQIESC